MNDQFQFRPSVEPARVAGVVPVSYGSFEQASDDGDASIVLSSEWGLTIYLTAPARLVRCDAQTLWLLLSDLDAIYWMLGDTNLTVVSLLRAPIGSAVISAEGARADVVDGVWMDAHFESDIRNQAEEVIRGERPRISLSLLRAERDREIERRRTLRSTSSFPFAWDFDVFPPTLPFWPLKFSEPPPS